MRLRPRHQHVGTTHNLLTWIYRQQAERSHERLLATAIVEQGAESSEVQAPVRGALPGDRAKLRGIPVIVEGGLSGTVPGTQPELEVVRRESRAA